MCVVFKGLGTGLFVAGETLGIAGARCRFLIRVPSMNAAADSFPFDSQPVPFNPAAPRYGGPGLRSLWALIRSHAGNIKSCAHVMAIWEDGHVFLAQWILELVHVPEDLCSLRWLLRFRELAKLGDDLSDCMVLACPPAHIDAPCLELVVAFSRIREPSRCAG